jgi:hypothetical protein
MHKRAGISGAAVRRGAVMAGGVAGLVLGATLLSAPAAGADPPAARPTVVPGDSGGVYAHDYPFIDYQGAPTHNEIARLQARLASGMLTLAYRAPRGYLDSVLAALSIDPASQSVVFSKTSLQSDLISAATPRALYFNDDTYIGWMPGTQILEVATMDSQRGAVFYTLPQPQDGVPRFQRETTRCLTCHDTYSMSGGGVPMFLFLSAYSREQNEIITDGVARAADEATPLSERWGGWYVTGRIGGLAQLGNLLPSPSGHLPASAAQPLDRGRLTGLFDTGPYLADTSDAAALLVLAHEVNVHDLMVRASFKSRVLMEQQQPGSGATGLTWEQLSPVTGRRMQALLEPLVRALLFSRAAPLPAPVEGDAAFQRGFEARGPRDGEGRSLRDLDLKTRLFKHPLSFLIYSESFDGLPPLVRSYVYRRLGEVLTGADQSPDFAHLSAADRQAIVEILKATKPDFVKALAQDGHPGAMLRPGG